MKNKIQKYIDQHKKIEELIDSSSELFGFSDGSKFYDYIFEIDNYMMQEVMQKIGDDSNWLDWFIFENDCGEKAMEAGYDKNLKPIKTIDDLIELIEEGKRR